MKSIYLTALLGALLFSSPSFAAPSAGGANILKNSALESVDGIGLPDDWKTSGEANFERMTGTLRIQGAPGEISQPVELTNFAKRRLSFSIEVKGDGATLNVYLAGNFRGSAQTFKKEILSNVVPSADWKTFSQVITLDVGGAIETARIVLEKSSAGSITLRNPQLIPDGLTATQTLEVVHEERELHYALRQLEDSSLEESERVQLAKPLQTALAGAASRDRTSLTRLPEWKKARQAVQFAILQATAEGREAVLAPAWPFRPLEPGINPIQAAKDWKIPAPVALAGLPSPFSFVLTNPSKEPREWTIRVSIDGHAMDAALRRQIFMDGWYTKGKARQADPLTMVPSDAPGVFRVSVAPLDSVQFYADLPPLPPGKAEVQVLVAAQEKVVAELTQAIETLPGRWDAKVALPFDYLACCAAGVSIFGSNPEAPMRSMEDMGVTAFEWVGIPKPNIAADGTIKEFDYSAVDLWLEKLAKTSLRPALFWHPRAAWKLPDGTPIERNSPEWLRIYTEVTEAFFQRAESKGVPRERFMLWLADEPHSRDPDLTKRPDEGILMVVKILETFRTKFPNVPILTTLTDYASFKDLEAFAPLTDILVPLWNYRDMELKFAPPGLNAREQYFARVLPYLRNLQKNEGKEVWSYFIMSGKDSPATTYYLAYPVLASQMGLTGAGHWAYSMPIGSSWDDTDGRLPDYQIVYNGKENHPLNQQWNTAEEAIVPSIRWFALREGLRDARIFRTLTEKLEARPGDDPLRVRFEKLRDEIQKLGGTTGYGLDLVLPRQEGRFPNPDTSAEEAWWKARQELQRIYSDYLESHS